MHTFNKTSRTNGFTIVELLIVVVVIAILASISLVSFTHIQGRARDSTRAQDIKVITQALEKYYLANGFYPPGRCTANCRINSGWSNTNDGSWSHLESALVPTYVDELPTDPNPTLNQNPQLAGVYGYGYFSTQGSYCGAGTKTYILIYKFESRSQQNTFYGNCAPTTLGPYTNNSNYRVVN